LDDSFPPLLLDLMHELTTLGGEHAEPVQLGQLRFPSCQDP
jgi:hypothetical protein